MSQHDPRGAGSHRHEHANDWAVVGAIALIGLGIWFLLGNIFGSWWQEAVRQAFRIVWPLALIALGVLLYLSSTRGGLRPGANGMRLYRSRSNRMVGGVLAGVAAYFGTDPTIARVVFVVLALVVGVWPAIVAYVIAMVLVPEEPPGGPVAEAPVWPTTGPPTVTPSPKPTQGWPHGGTETVQTPPAAPTPPAPPAEPGPPPPPAPPESGEPSEQS